MFVNGSCVGRQRAPCRCYRLYFELLSELGLELGPLLTSELNLAAEVVFEDDLLRVREVDCGATTLNATHSDLAHFGRTLGCHDDTSFL